MKKNAILFLVIALVLVSSGIWLYNSYGQFSITDLLQFGIVLILVGFGLFIAIKRAGSARRGEPAEDELTKKILQKTAAISYYISLYLWVFLIWLKDRVKFDTEELLGSGILMMGMIFGITWLVLHFKGIKDDQ